MLSYSAMRILYLANGIPVPGSLGGSTHATEVAQGLAVRGHEVHLIAAQRSGWSGFAPLLRSPKPQPYAGFHLYQHNVPKALTLLAWKPLFNLVKKISPDVIMERYYNFAGAGVWAAQRLGLPCLLEVNALIVDPQVIFKRRLDDLLGGPMRYWALKQCQWAACIVTPLQTTIPSEIPRQKIVELPWGANVMRFQTAAERNGKAQDKEALAIFVGSFRAWHGALDFVRAADLLLAAGKPYRFKLIGDGPERALAEQLAKAWPTQITFTGALPYAAIPGELKQAVVGVAPFTTAGHPALQAAGFFWSPLKVYEYMAAGLPVVTTDLPPLRSIIREAQEGYLFPEGNVKALAGAIERVLEDQAQAFKLGQQARSRVVAHYSWARHCAELERLLTQI